jgi:hypothetical protein
MGRGKEAADHLKRQADERQQQQSANLKRSLNTQQNSDSNWNALVESLQNEVAEFVENFPKAKSQNLRADLLHSNNLTISTQVQPILKIEVFRNYPKPGVHADVTRQISYEFEQVHTPYYDFSPEGFTDGHYQYSPEELAGKFFEYVPEFFA